MASAADGGAKPAGLEALHQLKSTEPPLYLTPSPKLSKAARLASEYLFASLSPYAPKSPFSHLLTEGFDAEQIWQQIDLQAQPMLSSLRRQVRSFEKNPSEIINQFNLDNESGKEGKLLEDGKTKENGGVESESEDFDDDEDDDEEEVEEDEEGEEGEGEENDDEDDKDMENEEGEKVNGVEDKFLKIKELEEYLVEDEAREYGLKKDTKKNKRKRGAIADEDEEDEDEEGDEDEDDELGLMGLEDDDGSKNARYEDFFTSKKRTNLKKKSKYDDESDDMDMDEPDNDDGNQNEHRLSVHEKELGELRAKVEEMEKANTQGKTKQTLSTHEKELEKLRAEIEAMERANLEPKTWTMQGEVTAAERSKNSALEVDIDFEHNVIPVPVPTVEDNASLEELIQKRIVEGQFDDVQRPPTILNKAPREKKELDENKSKKGLAELYEEEFAQKTGLVSTALSFSDEQKKEASMLFKKLCVKLDALSHFHFAPKPVIEDMSIQANVPALAIEEVAPLAVSDAAMLAPEEVFSGKGNIKEETELTKADRKRRRAKKKRQFKAESVKQMTVKAQLSTLKKLDNGDGDS